MSKHKTLMQTNGLSNKIFFTLLILILFRFGTYIPLPGINPSAMAEVAKQNANGILGVFNMFTGGALGRMSIFALNIMPYITASIIIQLLTVLSKDLNMLKKEGEIGKEKINKYTKYLAILLAIFQGYGITVGMENLDVNQVKVVYSPGIQFEFISTITMVGGTIFVIWLTDQISTYGIGNGSSIVIFSGIVASLPSSVSTLLQMTKSGSLSVFMLILITILCMSIIGVVVFFEKAYRKIAVHYPKRVIGNKMYSAEKTHLPLKINTAGVLAPIFASSLLLFPTTIFTLLGQNSNNSWYALIANQLSHGKPVFILLYIILIFFFSFFYTTAIFNPQETADNLKKSGAIVHNKRPGEQTFQYINNILKKLTVIGASYVSFICVIPEILISQYAIPMYLGGTSILITVNVVMDIFQQFQSYFMSKNYSLMKNKIY